MTDDKKLFPDINPDKAAPLIAILVMGCLIYSVEIIVPKDVSTSIQTAYTGALFVTHGAVFVLIMAVSHKIK